MPIGRALQADAQLFRADIDSHKKILVQRRVLPVNCSRSPDPEPSPADLVMQALGPQILRGMDEEGGGPIYKSSSLASGAVGLTRNMVCFWKSRRAVEADALWKAGCATFPQGLDFLTEIHSSHSPDGGSESQNLLPHQ